VEGAPHFKAEHLPVFDCSLAARADARLRGRTTRRRRSRSFRRDFETINMPEESTIQDISNAYMESWKLGLKAVAVYADNSKNRNR